jgi:hypothetical protein
MSVQAQYWFDGAAYMVTEPIEGDTILQKTTFPLTAIFQNLGQSDLGRVPVRFLIRRCSDNQIVFKSDTSISEFYLDTPAVQVSFPTHQGANDVRKLLPGCYVGAAIIREVNDGDRTNDTAFANFEILENTLDVDMAAEAISFPPNKYISPPGLPLSVMVTFRNDGLGVADNFISAAHIFDQNGNLAYSSTISTSAWLSGESRVISFAPFSYPASGAYTLVAVAEMYEDHYPYNDTVISKFTVGNPCEVGVISITEPSDNALVTPGEGFVPSGTIRWEGNTVPVPDIPLALIIGPCDERWNILYRYDTTISHKSIGTGDLKVTFNSKSTFQAIKTLDTGRYEVSLISELQCDADRMNDTAFADVHIVLSHDIGADSIISPKNIQYIHGHPLAIECLFRNNGANAESGIPVRLAIIDHGGRTVFQESIILPYLQSGSSVDTTFSAFTTEFIDSYRIEIISELASDQIRRNDTIRGNFRITSEADIAALAVVNPTPNAVIPLGQAFQPEGLFQAFFRSQDFINIPVRCEILRCTDQEVVFQSTSSIPRLLPDSPAIVFSFPTQQDSFDIRNLPAGCYRLNIIANYPSEIDRSDDTAYISFSVFGRSIVRDENESPDGVIVYQNFPNPFVASTTLTYLLPQDGRITLRIFDITGRVIEIAATNAAEVAGTHFITLNMQNLPSGIYIYELTFTNEAGEVTRRSQRMAVLK